MYWVSSFSWLNIKFQSKFNQAILLVGFASCCSRPASENFLTFCVGTKTTRQFQTKEKKSKRTHKQCVFVLLVCNQDETKKWNDYAKEHFVMCITLQCLLPSKLSPSTEAKFFTMNYITFKSKFFTAVSVLHCLNNLFILKPSISVEKSRPSKFNPNFSAVK